MTGEFPVPQEIAEAGIEDVAEAVPPTGEEGDTMSAQLQRLLDDAKKQGVTLETLGTNLAEVNAATPGTEWSGKSSDGRDVKLIKNPNTPEGEESYNFTI